VFQVSGGNAGFTGYTQGSANTTLNTNIPANTIIVQAPTAVTAYAITRPGVAASGTLIGTNASAVITQGFSGDTNHSATVTTGSGTSIGSTSLCSTTFCPVWYLSSERLYRYYYRLRHVRIVHCKLNLYRRPRVKNSPLHLEGTGSVPATGVLTTTSTANFGYDAFILRSTGSASINYSTTAVACGTAGPMVGKLYLSVEPLQ